jgi:hypothetical protein
VDSLGHGEWSALKATARRPRHAAG